MLPMLDFEWQRDEAAYQLLPPGTSDPRGEEIANFAPVVEFPAGFVEQVQNRLRRPASVEQHAATRRADEAQLPGLHGLAAFERIVPRGGKLVSYRPPPGLAWLFANRAQTKEGLLDLYNRFGPLTLAGNRQGEDIRLGISEAMQMYWLLKASPEQRSQFLARKEILIGSCFVWM